MTLTSLREIELFIIILFCLIVNISICTMSSLTRYPSSLSKVIRPTILPTGSNGQIESTFLSVLSYNILLPNSLDGWWCYKMYSPRHQIPIEETSWSHRSALLKQQVGTAGCDVVCFQETCGDSFDQDFEFMKWLGYDQFVLYRKGRFRPATFWKSSRLELVGQPLHRDRCLITCFKKLFKNYHDEAKKTLDERESYIWITNCHLQAGDNALRRFRQTYDCLDTIRKEKNKLLNAIKSQASARNNNKLNKKANKNIPINSTSEPLLPKFTYILIGDTNVDGRLERIQNNLPCSAIEKLLCEGQVPAGYLEDNQVITHKDKSQTLGLFTDVYEFAYSMSDDSESAAADSSRVSDSTILKGNMCDRTQARSIFPPPTMVVENLYNVLTTSLHSSVNVTVTLDVPSADSGSSGSSHDFTNLASDTGNKTAVDKIGQWDRHVLSELGLDRITKMFQSFATDTGTDTDTSLTTDHFEKRMNYENVCKWLLTINKQIGRGSEFRSAVKHMNNNIIKNDLNHNHVHQENVIHTASDHTSDNNKNNKMVPEVNDVESSDNENDDNLNDRNAGMVLPIQGYLTLQNFIDIYNNEIHLGKVWGVAYDMYACGFPLPFDSSNDEVFTSRFDRCYVAFDWSSDAADTNAADSMSELLSLIAVRDTGGSRSNCKSSSSCLPNKFHPSDHLPILVALGGI